MPHEAKGIERVLARDPACHNSSLLTPTSTAPMLGRISEFPWLGVGDRLSHPMIAYNPGNLLRRLVSPRGHPEPVPDESPAAALQSRRTPPATCPALRPPVSREPLDADALSADSPAHRAPRVASDVIERT